MNKKIGILLIVVMTLLLLSGCGVPQEDYDTVIAERDAAQAKGASLQSNLNRVTEEAGDQLSSFQEQIAKLKSACISAAVFPTSQPTVVDDNYQLEILVPGSYLHGVCGIAVNSEDKLYAADVFSQTIWEVTIEDGQPRITEFIGPPDGEADDIAFSPEDNPYWTSILDGVVRCKIGDEIKIVAQIGMGVNAIAFNDEGRLIVTQSVLTDGLWEIDPEGVEEPRLIARNFGQPNSCDFGPDGKLYTALYSGEAIARVDIDSGEIEIVADGFTVPVAAKFDSKGNLYALEATTGEVFGVDIETGKKTLIAQIPPSGDNMIFNSRDELFVTRNLGGIYRVDIDTGRVATLTEAKLTWPSGLDVAGGTVYVADLWSIKQVNERTGEVTSMGIGYDTELQYPRCIAVRDGRVVIGGLFNLVYEFDLASRHVTKTYGGFQLRNDILILDDGSILVAEMGNGSLVKVSGEEGKVREKVTSGLEGPVGLAFATEGEVYVTEALAGNVTRVNLATGEKTVIATGLQMPKGIAVEADGTILVVEVGLKRLVQIDPESGGVKPLVTDLAIGSPSGGIWLPASIMMCDVAVSDSGAIYVLGEAENVLYKITRK